MVGNDSLAVTRRTRAVGFLGGLGMQCSISEQTRTTVSNFPTVSIGFPRIKTKTKGTKIKKPCCPLQCSQGSSNALVTPFFHLSMYLRST